MASSEAQHEFDELMRNKEHRTTHPEDDHEAKIDHVELESTAPEPAPPRQSMTSARDTIPFKRQGANTGPKGVISDAQNFRESAREHRSARASTTIAREEPTLTFGQRELIEALDKIAEDGNDDFEEDLDDEFVSQWRQQRLQALRGGDYGSGLQGQLKFGGLSTVDGEGYLEAIEQSPGVVVVYIADDVSEVSQLFEGCLRILARKHHNTKFVKLAYDEAEIQAEGVPGIIAYRNGDKFAALIPLLDEMPDDGDLDADTLEKVLQRHQILR